MSAPISPTLRRPRAVPGGIVFDVQRPLPHRVGCSANSPLDAIWKVAGWFSNTDRATPALDPMRTLCDAVVQNLSADKLKRKASDATTGKLVAILSEAETLAPSLRKGVEKSVVGQTERISKNVPDEKDDKDDIAGNGALFLEKMTSIIKDFQSGNDFAESWQNLLTIVSFLPESQRTNSLASLIDLIAHLPSGDIRANGFHGVAHKIIAACPEDQPVLAGKLISVISSLAEDKQKVKAIQQIILLLRGINGLDISKQLGDLLCPVWELGSTNDVKQCFTDIGYVAQKLPTEGRLAVINTLADNLPKLAGKDALGSGIEFLMKEIELADPVIYRSVLTRIENSLSKIAGEIYHGIEIDRDQVSQHRDFEELSATLKFLPYDLQQKVIGSLTDITGATADKKRHTGHLIDSDKP